LELFALSIAWIVLLGDSLHAVLGRFSTDTYKIIGFFIVVPTTLLPLHLLSIPSLISLFSSFLLILILLIDGFSKSAAPGSIIHPVKTSLGPDMENYNFLGGLGLLIAGFGGHAIIPSLALDMKSPHKFNKVCDWAFGIASVIFMITGTAGYLMFGDKVTDEVRFCASPLRDGKGKRLT
jgi:vesicular inhibitory amino acid transporter